MTPSHSNSTLRSVGAVLLGYIILVAIILGCFTIVQKLLTLDQSFEPATFATTDFMIGFSLAVSLMAAVVAGFACAVIAGSRRPTYVFAGIVGVLGLITMLFTLSAANPEPKPRSGGESNEVIMAQSTAQKPIWLRNV